MMSHPGVHADDDLTVVRAVAIKEDSCTIDLTEWGESGVAIWSFACWPYRCEERHS